MIGEFPLVFESDKSSLSEALEDHCSDVAESVQAGTRIVVLSDKMIDKGNVPIPAILAVSAVHHHLIRAGLRTNCSIIVESGEPREVHHFAVAQGLHEAIHELFG